MMKSADYLQSVKTLVSENKKGVAFSTKILGDSSVHQFTKIRSSESFPEFSNDNSDDSQNFIDAWLRREL